MAEIRRDCDGHLTNECPGVDDETECFACRAKPDAYWFTTPTVAVCRNCATNVLPKLASDAIAAVHVRGPRVNLGLFHDALAKMTSSFWYGVACALSRRTGTDTPR